MLSKVLGARPSSEYIRQWHGSPRSYILLKETGIEQVKAYMRYIQMITCGVKKIK